MAKIDNGGAKTLNFGKITLLSLFFLPPRGSKLHCQLRWRGHGRISPLWTCPRNALQGRITNVGDLGFDPGSLHRATGEKVTVSEDFPIFRGTDNRQSVLGS